MRIHRGSRSDVLILSATSFLADASSSMVFPLMTLSLNKVLGVGLSLIGLMQGVVESAASLLKVISSRLGERKPPTAGGH